VVFGCSDGFGQPYPTPNPSYVEEFWSDANGLMELWSVDLGRLGIFCGVESVDVCVGICCHRDLRLKKST
jgi:hypothetical protein